MRAEIVKACNLMVEEADESEFVEEVIFQALGCIAYELGLQVSSIDENPLDLAAQELGFDHQYAFMNYVLNETEKKIGQTITRQEMAEVVLHSAMPAMPAKMTKTRIQQLKEKYPNPQKSDNDIGDSYCVGGTIVLEQNGISAFPMPNTLCRFLLKEHAISKETLLGTNPEAYKKLYSLCEDVINQNDVCNFGNAWDSLDAAIQLAAACNEDST